MPSSLKKQGTVVTFLFYDENKKPSGSYIRKIKETFSVLLVLKNKIQYVVLKWETYLWPK